ncbi:cupin domain-containing protein [Pseudalkalibacillus hwajinpoensis]|uniref:Cupin domain-containing protein n=1 Tax=Guptibacillus hwajinpoensis TaxID=208199 RepID=A0A4V5PZ16_9BACL|nr:cupin domain-containing protein [Pseudalkalibacillus hwajinpoensis]TKD72248.1 cupin domain-containing protein [Pseudalkalibacillus hwajinpoensis]
MTSPVSGYITDNRNLVGRNGTPDLFYNIEDNLAFERDPENLLYLISSQQMPAMIGGSLGDLRMSKGSIREPHWHTNSWELVYLASGSATVGILDPNNDKVRKYKLKKAGETVFIPMGYLHWISADSDDTQLLLFFNNDRFQTQDGSKMLTQTPLEVYEQAYNIEPKKMKKALEPIEGQGAVVIGPPPSLSRKRNRKRR